MQSNNKYVGVLRYEREREREREITAKKNI
jgi:hypothetical protein